MNLTADTIRAHLPSFGYEPTDNDTIMITHALDRAIHRALSYTNQEKIPRGLEKEIINMAVGEFLFLKKSIGALDDGENGIEFNAHITQFTEGDTNISAKDKGTNNEVNFENWINYLRFGDPIVLEHFRRIHW